MNFKYVSGELVKKDDRISVTLNCGVVQDVFSPHTLKAKDFSCFETGGILLYFDNGDLQLWPFINEDLVFLNRAL